MHLGANAANRGLSRMTLIAWIGEWKRGNMSGLETSATRRCQLSEPGFVGFKDFQDKRFAFRQNARRIWVRTPQIADCRGLRGF